MSLVSLSLSLSLGFLHLHWIMGYVRTCGGILCIILVIQEHLSFVNWKMLFCSFYNRLFNDLCYADLELNVLMIWILSSKTFSIWCSYIG